MYLYYGHDGNARRNEDSRETYGDEISNQLRKLGWIVYDKSKHKPVARHNVKYILLNTLLKENCIQMLIFHLRHGFDPFQYHCPLP